MKRITQRSTLGLLLYLATLALLLGDPAGSSSTKSLAEEFGSLRHARVAVEMGEEKKPLTYFARSFSEEDRLILSKIAPNLKVVTGLSAEKAIAHAEEAHGVDARYATAEFIEKAVNLRWVQVPSAGVDRYLDNEPLMSREEIVLTNSRAVHGPTIADHAMAMLLYLTRNLDHFAANQREGEWRKSGKTPRQAIALKGKTLLVVGLGGIGSEIAQRGHGFGMRVIGTRRSDSPNADYIEKVGKPQDLLKMLPEADVVALAVPLVPETEHLINAEAFKLMKEGSYLINIARGGVVDTEALIENLESGHLAGAGLDVTDPEPLPKGHALWSQPNVIITPHIAGRAKVTDERRAALKIENLRRFGAGEPLLNVVDKKAGY